MNTRTWFIYLIIGVGILSMLQSCNNVEPIPSTVQYLEIPEGFPDIVFPEDNEFTNKRWELGKKLFFDPFLSRDSSVSCATCHKPELAFADNQATTNGVFNRPGTRNSPS
ncbi:MAG: cytochrome-c peroxidase, partial [Salibacteraceae bacterium]